MTFLRNLLSKVLSPDVQRIQFFWVTRQFSDSLNFIEAELLGGIF